MKCRKYMESAYLPPLPCGGGEWVGWTIPWKAGQERATRTHISRYTKYTKIYQTITKEKHIFNTYIHISYRKIYKKHSIQEQINFRACTLSSFNFLLLYKKNMNVSKMLVSEKAAILLQCFCSFLSGESKLRLRSVGCRTFRWIQKLQDPHGAGSRHRRHVADEFELPGEKNSGKHHVEVRAHDNQQVNTFTKEEFV